MPKFSLRGFKTDGRGANQVLGDLETAVMELLWRTPLTTLDRMFRKGYLTRKKEGKAFVYAPRYTREEFERGMAEEVFGAILKGVGDPALSTFVDMVGEDAAQLDKLEALIREKRKGGAQ
jgi:BlaI family transcriptional regulator, penicillinase repressor